MTFSQNQLIANICHGNVPRQIGKQGTGISSALKALSYDEKIVKIGPLYPEILD